MKTELKNYWVKNSTIQNSTIQSFFVESVENEVFAVIEAEKVWKRGGYIFHPEMSVAIETTDVLPEL